MKKAIILSIAILTLWHMDNAAIKRLVRRWSVCLCRKIFARLALPLQVGGGTAIVFAPHPDDETLGCGALIARKRTNGWPVHIVFITDGSASHPGHPTLTPDALRERRHREAMEALSTLGVESDCIHFLDTTDGTLPRLSPGLREALISSIGSIFDNVRPEKIYLPCHRDGSSEHDAAFNIVIMGLLRSKCRPSIWQYPIWTWWNPLLVLEHLVFSGWYYRLHSEDFHSFKQQAIACYKSQTHPVPPWTTATVPPELLAIFRREHEFFFRYDLTDDSVRPAELGRSPIL